MNYERRPNLRCQRGLRFDYTLERETPREQLLAAVEALFEGKAVRADEQWGARHVNRMVLQFRFELRIGERERQLSVLYRRTCPDSERERIAGELDALLHALP